MTWSSREYLAQCQRLHELGVAPNFRPGERVGRAFADLGCEEFYLVNESRLVSIFAGKFSELEDQHRHFFFLIPACDELIQRIALAGYDIESLVFADQRTWQLVVTRSGTVHSLKFESRALENVLIEALITILSEPAEHV